MNIFLSSDLTINFSVLTKVNSFLSEHDLSRCTIYTTNSIVDKQFVEFAIRVGSDIKVIEIKSFLIDHIIESLSNKINFMVLCSTMDNSFYDKLFRECDLKSIPIRLIMNEWAYV